MPGRSEAGVALVIALMAILLLSGLGLTLALTTSGETMIAANHRDALQGLYAADSAIELALQDLRALPDWDRVLDGTARSSYVDGPPVGERLLADGSRINLSELRNQANCARRTPCSAAQMDALTEERPWGPNNPRWQIYLHAPLREIFAADGVASLFYVLVMVADDQAETDGDPTRDGLPPLNRGAGLVVVRAEAFGPRGARRAIDATLARTAVAGVGAPAAPVVRLVSWRARR